MKTKCVRVLDEGTDMRFLVMEPDNPEDYDALEWGGWNVETTRIVVCPVSRPGVIMGKFSHPPYDIDEHGSGIINNHTSQKFLEAIRGVLFYDIPDKIDVTGK
jgi:hypothetical protein